MDRQRAETTPIPLRELPGQAEFASTVASEIRAFAGDLIYTAVMTALMEGKTVEIVAPRRSVAQLLIDGIPHAPLSNFDL